METARRCIKTSVAADLTVAGGRLWASLLSSVTRPRYGGRGVVVRTGPRRFQVFPEEKRPCVEYISGEQVRRAGSELKDVQGWGGGVKLSMMS